MQKLWVLMSGLEFLTQNKSKMSCQKVINYWNIQNCIHIWTILTKGHGEPMFGVILK